MSLATPETSDNEEGNSTRISQLTTVESSNALEASKKALERLKLLLAQSEDFQPAGIHRGVPVSYLEAPSPNGHPKEAKVYRASTVLAVKPADVYRHLREPQDWDEWKPDCSMIEDIDQDTSVIYTILNIPGTSQQIDTATVERVAAHEHGGGILHVATSISSDLIPSVQGRQRASIALQAWALLPRSDGASTEVVFFIQLANRTLRHPYKLSMRRQAISKHASHSVANLAAAVLQSSTPALAAGNSDSAASSMKDRPERKRLLSVSPGSFRMRSRSMRKSGLGHLRNKSSDANLDLSTPASSTGSLSINPITSKNIAPVEQSPNPPATVDADADTSARPHLLQEAPSDATLDSLHEDLAKLSQDSSSWKLSQTADGQKIWTLAIDGQALPKYKVETVIMGSDTEGVLAAITSTISRKQWQQHFRHSSFDGTLQTDMFSGLYPHLNNFFTTTQSSIRRSRTDTLNPSISLVSKSQTHGDNSPNSPGPEFTVQGQVILDGWQLIPRHHEVIVRHFSHLEFSEQQQRPLPGYLGKVLAAEAAGDLVRLKSFIEHAQIPPTFVRWGAGPRFVRSEECDDSAAVIFNTEVSKDSRPLEQKAWLFFHKNAAFASGAELACEPTDALNSISSVAEFPGLWQIQWAADSKRAVLSLRPAKVEQGLLSWNGSPVKNEIQAPRRAAGPGEEAAPEEESQDENELDDSQPENMKTASSAGMGLGAAAIASTEANSDHQQQGLERSLKPTVTPGNSFVADVRDLTPHQVYFVLLIASLSFLSGVYMSTVYSTS